MLRASLLSSSTSAGSAFFSAAIFAFSLRHFFRPRHGRAAINDRRLQLLAVKYGLRLRLRFVPVFCAASSSQLMSLFKCQAAACAA